MQKTGTRNTGAAIVLAVGALITLLLAGFAQDSLFRIHMGVVTVALGIAAIVALRRIDFSGSALVDDESGYMDGPIRVGAIMTVFWGVVGFPVGVIVAT